MRRAIMKLLPPSSPRSSLPERVLPKSSSETARNVTSNLRGLSSRGNCSLAMTTQRLDPRSTTWSIRSENGVLKATQFHNAIRDRWTSTGCSGMNPNVSVVDLTADRRPTTRHSHSPTDAQDTLNVQRRIERSGLVQSRALKISLSIKSWTHGQFARLPLDIKNARLCCLDQSL